MERAVPVILIIHQRIKLCANHLLLEYGVYNVLQSSRAAQNGQGSHILTREKAGGSRWSLQTHKKVGVPVQ